MRYIILALTLTLTACGKVNMNIEDLDSVPVVTQFSNVSTGEFVSASNSPHSTVSNYKVTASVGYITEKNKTEITTTGGNYKVYLGVNGQIISTQ